VRDTFQAVARGGEQEIGVDRRIPNRLIWLDGKLVPWGEVMVHVLSHSVQRGSLVFDYMPVYETPRGPAVFRLPEHVARLFQSVGLVGLPLARRPEELRAAVVETVRANPGAKAVKISAYLPSIEVDVVPVDTHVAVAIAAYDPRRDVLAHKAVPPPPAPTALRVWLEKVRRQRRRDILPPQAKVAANYASPMGAKWEAKKHGYDEVLLIDEDGFIAEGPTTNVFLVDAAGHLHTPAEEHVLPGVTRSSVLELAKHAGLTAVEEPFRSEELLAAAEVFLTGTSGGVTPVVSVDDRKIGAVCPGPVTLRLRERFEAAAHGRDPAFEHWLTYVEGAR